jgi:uncharacterized RDD family membrane protein YckC
MGKRVLALLIDWFLCYLIVSALTHHSVTKVTDSAYWATQYSTLVACFLEMWLFTAVSGFSVGKRVVRIRVTRTNGARPGFGWAALRTILMFFVIPPLISDRDLRGLHDRASDTVVIRM